MNYASNQAVTNNHPKSSGITSRLNTSVYVYHKKILLSHICKNPQAVSDSIFYYSSPKEMYYEYKITQFIENTTIKTAI